MRSAPREAREGASTSLKPFDDEMWAMFLGMCMEAHCHRDAEVWITTQLRWNSAPQAWTYCAGHAPAWIGFFVRCHLYYLQIEQAGTFQPTLPLG